MRCVRLLGLAAAAAACTSPDREPTAPPRAAASVASASAAAQGEGEEARAQAHIDLREVRAELLEADQEYAVLASGTNLVEALVAPLSDDAVFLAPGGRITRGPDETRDVLLENPANIASRWEWFAIRADVSADGSRGYTYGYTELTLPNGAVLPGKYHAYWARQANGSWKIAGYKRSARAAGAVSPVPPEGFETPTTKHRRYFPNTEPAEVLTAVMAADVAFSDAAQVLPLGAAFARYAAPDGAQTGGGGAVTWAFGPAAIAAAYEGVPAGFVSWLPSFGDAAASGDLAFTAGFVRQGTNPFGTYLSIWRRSDSGEWLYVVD